MTTENNKLIAEFMDVPHLYSTVRVETLKYNTDWNWLMEVVEKIESLGYWIEILGGVHNVCRIGITNNIEDFICLDNETKIEAVYNACLEFIKWYNQQ